MSYLKKVFILLYPVMILSLLGCPQAFKVPVEVPVVIQRDYTQIKIADPDREDILKRAKKKKDKNSKLCEKDEKCEDICEDIFPRGDRDDCEELSVKQVKRIEALHELFEDPDINDLEDIEIGDGEDLNLYLNISIEPLDKLVSKYKKREAEDFLIWLAEFPDAVEIIAKEDEDYNLLEALLKKIYVKRLCKKFLNPS